MAAYAAPGSDNPAGALVRSRPVDKVQAPKLQLASRLGSALDSPAFIDYGDHGMGGSPSGENECMRWIVVDVAK